VEKRKMKSIFIASMTGFLFVGCASSFGIQVVQGLPEEVYLTFAKGTSVEVGEVFVLYHVERTSAGGGGGGHTGHGGGAQGGGGANMRHEVGRVQVVRIADDTHALVKVLSGTASEGRVVERVD
jgi:hypothetical protein